MKRILITCAAVCLALAATAARTTRHSSTSTSSTRRSGSSSGKSTSHVADEFRPRAANRSVTAASFAPKRTKPVFTGEFVVDVIFITFPDCEDVDLAQGVKALSRVRGSTISDYYKEYSQGITWPVLRTFARPYQAPHPLGYYCRHDHFSNRIGFGGGEGGARAAELRAAALAASKSFGYLEGSPSGKASVTCYCYCRALNSERVERLLRPHYPKKEDGTDEIGMYKPPIPWRDPLWPNSIPQVMYPGDGGTMVHELGHVLGAPDFYHATEKYDGLPGSPSLPWAWGPTGPAYCRYIYQGFLPATSYPMYTQSGTYTISPRATNPAGDKALGCFVPSAHPNYLFYLEYVKDEKAPIGSAGQEGLLIHVINVTFSSPMMGPPDLCYTYRPNDPYFRALNGHTSEAFFREGDKFDAESNPAARLPNLIPAGISVKNIKFSSEGATFDLTVEKKKLAAREISSSLLPKVALTEVDELLPTSFRAHCDVLYRGEPLMTEYGFCYDVTPHPTLLRGRFPLYHRDRYDGRILGLMPGKTYYVRAYVKNADGITYSAEEKKVTLPTLDDVPDQVAPLLTDHIRGNFYYNRWYFQTKHDVHDTANPLLTFMSLAAYYRALPGYPPKARAPFDMTRIHFHPSDSRPDFRLAETGELQGRMTRFVKEAGLRRREFGAGWDKTFLAALGYRKPPKESIIIPVEKETITAFSRRIRESITLAQPVMLIRENQIVPPDTNSYYPLDIVLIDGYSGEDTFHMSFPTGKDRGLRRSGDYKLEDVLDYVVLAKLVFYSPVPSPVSFPKYGR